LPIVEVVLGGDVSVAAHAEEGVAVNSGFLNGLQTPEAKAKMIAWLEEKGLGQGETTYKLRDWLFSRQRYWGEPFPILHNPATGEIRAVPYADLPITLPELSEYKPTADGQPPLARAEDWMKVELDGEQLLRETNTMPQWAGSCWYYLRYMDPTNDKLPFDPAAEKYWGPVDLYVGGVEHAVLHLLYSRFWHKVLFDCGLVSTREPFKKLFNQGMILGISHRDENGRFYAPGDVEYRDGKPYAKGRRHCSAPAKRRCPSPRLNVVNPDDVVAEYGADSLRLYEMFMGPLEAVKPWQTNGIAKVTADIENLRFNTAIARMMEALNLFKREKTVNQGVVDIFVRLLSPFAPHLAEELWARLGHSESLAYAAWPVFDPALVIENTATIAVQVNGKLRATIQLPKGTPQPEVEAAALAEDGVIRALDGKPPRKVIVVPDRIVNIVA
jgi:leucyl-tRNA synthetase